MKQDMITRVRDETKKLLSGNHFQHLCLKVLECNRPEHSIIDKQKIETDADELNRLLLSAKEKDAKTKFVEIFSERSWNHIAGIADIFEKISQKFTLQAAIENRFGAGSDTAQALCTIVTFSQLPYDFWARKLLAAMKGFGTNDNMLRRIIVSRCEIDMFNIREVFTLRYGNGKTLKNWIEEDTSGAYRILFLALCGY